MRRIYGNPLFKLLIIVLLAVTIPVAIWCGYGIIYFGEDLFAQDLSFADSKAALKITKGYVNDIVNEWYEGTLDEHQPYYKERTNIDFSLYTYYSSGGTYEMSYFSGHTVQWKKEFYYRYDGGRCEILSGSAAAEENISSGKSGIYGKAVIFLDESLEKNDRYAESYKVFQLLAPFRKLFLLLGLVAFATLAGVLFFTYRTAGVSRKSDQLKLYKIDRLPYVLLVLILIPVTYIHYVLATKAVLSANVGEVSRYINAIILLFSETLFIYAVLVSFARRIKTKTFLKTSLLGLFIYLFRNIPMKVAVAAAVVLFIILMIFAVSYPWLAILCSCAIVSGVLLMLVNGRKLLNASAQLAEGNLDYRINDEDLNHMLWFFRKHGEQLNSIADGMNTAVEKQMKSERMKTELITNVSHDIKTPLTSIINYVNLLKDDHTEEQEKEYIEVLSRNSERLKNLTEDIVEASKAATGNISVKPEKTNVLELTEQALAEFEKKLADAELTPVVKISEDINVMADGKLLWRIISNLLSNCVKYSMPGTRVYIEAAKTENNTAVISFKNISRDPLNVSADELMERFVRGDQSRSTEGSGLGLNIAKSLAVLQHGDLYLTIDGDYFKAEVEIPLF